MALLKKKIDRKRKSQQIGSSLELRILFPTQGIWRDQLSAIAIPEEEHATFLSELLIVSEVRFDDSMKDEPRIEKITDWQKCARCWKYTPDVGEEVGKNKKHPTLCKRCYNVVESSA